MVNPLKNQKKFEDQWKKQVDASNTLKAIKDVDEKNVDEKFLRYKEIFEKLSNKRASEIQDMAKPIDYNNLTYYFTRLNNNPTDFIRFKDPVCIYDDIKNGNISTEKKEEDQNQFKSDLNQISIGNPKYKKEYQLNAVTNIKNVYNSRQKDINFFIEYAKIRSEAIYKTKQGTGLQTLTPKQRLQRLAKLKINY